MTASPDDSLPAVNPLRVLGEGFLWRQAVVWAAGLAAVWLTGPGGAVVAAAVAAALALGHAALLVTHGGRLAAPESDARLQLQRAYRALAWCLAAVAFAAAAGWMTAQYAGPDSWGFGTPMNEYGPYGIAVAVFVLLFAVVAMAALWHFDAAKPVRAARWRRVRRALRPSRLFGPRYEDSAPED